MNFCTVALQLCEPFFKNKPKEKYMKIETDYCTSDSCRFQLFNESTLPGGHIGKNKEFTTYLLPWQSGNKKLV